MANNRMFLCHRPSGLAVYLGKRMADGWYNVPDDLAANVVAFFESPELRDDQDDVCVAMQHADAAPAAVEFNGMEHGPDHAPALLHLTGLRDLPQRRVYVSTPGDPSPFIEHFRRSRYEYQPPYDALAPFPVGPMPLDDAGCVTDQPVRLTVHGASAADAEAISLNERVHTAPVGSVVDGFRIVSRIMDATEVEPVDGGTWLDGSKVTPEEGEL